MKTATALTVVAVGAILAFAVTAQPSFFSFHVAGWVLMLTGIAGAAIPRRGYGWLRRRLVLNTAGQRKEIDLRQQRYSRLLVPGGLITETQDVGPANSVVDAPVESDTIEQYIEE
jgi:ABC-type transport system involved in cytochrome bd biosynthesis fused ATPase/permease subunit